ncbi:MAG: hypothetical protein PHD13_01915 [Methanocellales archaeon]|nr:hypothetical protein [Methanocellales archaeon]MDD3291035.1 hypothetical protein [Methanocellales archaeon]MDD5234920.1 hypothetical protein [Methanocellales archaeon]MDD5484710.1 hypothetical protein [Methanocellales archaeon]
MYNKELIIEEVREELSKIRQLLEFIARGNLKEELEKIATTPERKRIWTLCDGSLNTQTLAEKTGVAQRTVQIFIKELGGVDLIEIEKRGYPKRRFNYVPSEWNLEKG